MTSMFATLTRFARCGLQLALTGMALGLAACGEDGAQKASSEYVRSYFF